MNIGETDPSAIGGPHRAERDGKGPGCGGQSAATVPRHQGYFQPARARPNSQPLWPQSRGRRVARLRPEPLLVPQVHSGLVLHVHDRATTR